MTAVPLPPSHVIADHRQTTERLQFREGPTVGFYSRRYRLAWQVKLARSAPLFAHINESSFHPPQTVTMITAKINMLAVTNSRTGCAVGGKSKPSSDSDKTLEHFVRRYGECGNGHV